MSQKVLETDFPLIVPPNPPLSAHREGEGGHGRSSSLRRAYSEEEDQLLRKGGGGGESETSDYQSDEFHQGVRPAAFSFTQQR